MTDPLATVADAEAAGQSLVDQGAELVAKGEALVAAGDEAGQQLIEQGHQVVAQGQAGLRLVGEQGAAAARSVIDAASETLGALEEVLNDGAVQIGDQLMSVGQAIRDITEPAAAAMANAFEPLNDMADTLLKVPKLVLDVIKGVISLPGAVVAAYNLLAAEIHTADWTNKAENLRDRSLNYAEFLRLADIAGQNYPQCRVRGLDRIFRENTVIYDSTYDGYGGFERQWMTPRRVWRMPYWVNMARLGELGPADHNRLRDLLHQAMMYSGPDPDNEPWINVLGSGELEMDEVFNPVIFELLGPGHWGWLGYSTPLPDGTWSEEITRLARLSSPDYLAALLPFAGPQIYKDIMRRSIQDPWINVEVDQTREIAYSSADVGWQGYDVTVPGHPRPIDRWATRTYAARLGASPRAREVLAELARKAELRQNQIAAGTKGGRDLGPTFAATSYGAATSEASARALENRLGVTPVANIDWTHARPPVQPQALRDAGFDPAWRPAFSAAGVPEDVALLALRMLYGTLGARPTMPLSEVAALKAQLVKDHGAGAQAVFDRAREIALYGEAR